MALQEIKTVSMLVAVTLGGMLNSILIHIILRHTPSILLQTCITDLLLLFLTALCNPTSFRTEKGTGVIVHGIIYWLGLSEARLFCLIIFETFVYFVLISLYGVCIQYIYRYLTLNRNMDVPTQTYFKIAAPIAMIPLVYVVCATYSYYRPNSYLRENFVASLLGINVTAQQIPVAGYYTQSDLMSAAYYYNSATCLAAYLLLLILGWRMYHFVHRNLNGNGINQTKIRELNIQLTRTLIIEAFLPFSILVSVLFSVTITLFNISLVGGFGEAVLFYNAISTIPVYWTAVINPLITITIIKPYRRAFAKILKRLRYTDSINNITM